MRRILALAAALCLASPALAQPRPAPRPPAYTPSPPATRSGSPAGGVSGGMSTTASQDIANTLRQLRMNACAPAVQRAADFLIEGQPAKFTAQPLGPDANRWPVVFVIESGDPSGRTRLSSLMVTPDCSGMYQQTIWWPTPCDRLKATVFANFAAERTLMRDVRISELNPGLQLYLTPAGTGCISVKKELFR
ncbi:MAG: hypothetical protein U1E50_15710 [Caulobacteraceae bacterium]